MAVDSVARALAISGSGGGGGGGDSTIVLSGTLSNSKPSITSMTVEQFNAIAANVNAPIVIDCGGDSWPNLHVRVLEVVYNKTSNFLYFHVLYNMTNDRQGSSYFSAQLSSDHVYLNTITESEYYAGKELPAVTNADDGMVLKVLNGAWAKGRVSDLPDSPAESGKYILKVDTTGQDPVISWQPDYEIYNGTNYIVYDGQVG